MEILAQYQNGNTQTILYVDGTRERYLPDDEPGQPIHPESMDIKITNYCDLGCPYCHESSTEAGKHGDLDKLINILAAAKLPRGIEVAIGGGNPLAHPDLMSFLTELKQLGMVSNLTVNQGHIIRYNDLLVSLMERGLVYGLGISITNRNYKKLGRFLTNLGEHRQRVVFHVIAGVDDLEVLDELLKLEAQPKVLVLGYKTWGFGEQYFSPEVEQKIKHWYRFLPRYFDRVHLCFDNLGVEQLNMRRFFTSEGWETYFLGEDFTYTMYLDAVEQQYAPTSRSPLKLRKSFDDISLLEFFGQRDRSF